MFLSSSDTSGLSAGVIAAIIGLLVLVVELSLWSFVALRKRRPHRTD